MDIANVLLADTESHADAGRMANALETVREAVEAGVGVEIIFNGAGTRWVGELAKPRHKHHKLCRRLLLCVQVCDCRARAFGVFDQVEAAGVGRLSEHRGHPSLFARLRRGVAVLTV